MLELSWRSPIYLGYTPISTANNLGIGNFVNISTNRKDTSGRCLSSSTALGTTTVGKGEATTTCLDTKLYQFLDEPEGHQRPLRDGFGSENPGGGRRPGADSSAPRRPCPGVGRYRDQPQRRRPPCRARRPRGRPPKQWAALPEAGLGPVAWSVTLS